VLANDAGLEDVPITLSIAADPASGSAVINGDHTITYTPAAGFDGLMTFTYRVTDVHGEWDEATVYVTVLEEGVTNHVPIANDDEVETFINTPIDIDVLANDTGLEDGLQQLEIINEPSNGSADVNVDNTVRYTPNEMFVGTDTFVYRITDIHGENDMATVTISVIEHPIVALDDYVEVEKNSSILIDVLANDQGIEDLDVSISIVIFPINGYELVNADNTITYTPYIDYVGLDSLTYEVCALPDNCSQAVVRIQVKDVKPDKLIIPEGFSPDGDGINEYFEIIGLEYFGRVTIKVYNRWGNLVYINNNYKNDWDGKANASMSIGKTLPTGTYYYIIEIVDTKERFNGNVFLKR
jgi:gliding motility-associated-like protein